MFCLILCITTYVKTLKTMLSDKITEIFVSVDDFCKDFEQEIQKHRLTAKDKKSRNRNRTLSDSEMISILILFHYGQFTNFKAFYIYYVSAHLKDCFPQLISYNHFVELMPRVAVPMMLFLKSKCLGKCSGISFIVR